MFTSTKCAKEPFLHGPPADPVPFTSLPRSAQNPLMQSLLDVPKHFPSVYAPFGSFTHLTQGLFPEHLACVGH